MYPNAPFQSQRPCRQPFPVHKVVPHDSWESSMEFLDTTPAVAGIERREAPERFAQVVLGGGA